MADKLGIAVVGVGRIGVFHAQHVQEVGAELGNCELVAVVDAYGDLAAQVAAKLQPRQAAEVRAFKSVEELIASGASDGAVIASRTADHHAHAGALVEAGQRVLLEKPLTGSLASTTEFAAHLNADPSRRHAVMLAFMRRYDAPLVHARELMRAGRIGKVFKIVSVLEDPVPPPDGYSSPGLLADMSVHNIDEVIWLTGGFPKRVTGVGARLYNQKITSVREDFDDVFLQMWLDDDVVAQVQVSRNHVAGYRNETVMYGEEGLIHVGRFCEDPLLVSCLTYGRGGEVLDKREFRMRNYGKSVPVFMERFGPAYKAELIHFATQCQRDEPFDVDHDDGLRAMRVVDAGVTSLCTHDRAAAVSDD